MAQFKAFGAFTCPVAGVPRKLDLPATQQLKTCHAFSIQALPTNTGKVFVGTAALNKTTLDGVLAIIPTPTVNLLGSFTSALATGANAIPIDDLWIDVDTGGEGVIFSILEG
jgi:hypothetical protein